MKFKRAGDLRHRIRFQRRGAGRDAFGQPSGEWEDVETAWAAVEPLTGREFLGMQLAQSDITVRVVCHWTSKLAQITPKDRILHGSDVYDIRAVIDVGSRRKELQFMCTRHSIKIGES